MNVAILGTGDVGRALGSAFAALGHEVMMGARETGNPRAKDWAGSAGSRARTGTFADAANFGEVVVLAVKGTATQEVLQLAEPENFRGKLVLDAGNPLDHSTGVPRLAITGYDSLGERVQQALPGAAVVKCFNTVGNALMFRPELAGGPPTMFIAGNDADAKRRTAALLKDFGWEAADIGGIESSRYLEAMCLAWVLYGMHQGAWRHAFKLLRD
jgi:8-hydroxy-5-deazaflavin:NADPH oxidoreductase